jgi:tetratricopeptide (TPR) repeat protein
VYFSGTRVCRALAALFFLGLTVAVSCSRSKPPAAVERLAILRFENLTGDDSLDWAGRAVSEVVTAELAGSRTISVLSFGTLHALDRALGPRPLASPGISSERSAALLSGSSHILYGRISRAIPGSLRLNAAVFDTSRHRMERALAVTGRESDGIIRLADLLAKDLAAPVRPLETQNAQALRQYCAGLESPDPAAAERAFSMAADADPNFGPAFVAWAQLAASRNNRAEAERILGLASARGNSISELSRARLTALAAELRGDFGAGVQALESIGRLNPADIGLFGQLAQAYLNVRRYTDAAENERKALALEPNDAVLLNELGYTEMYAGNLAAATKALDEYRKIRPADANPLDSLGDVNFSLGQLTAAEQYYRQASEKDNSFNNGGELMKAAHARLLTGDIGEADKIFNRYLEARKNAKDPAVEFRRADWEFLSGRRRQAIARLNAFIRGLTPASAIVMAPKAYAQLTLWNLVLGDRAQARAAGLRAGALARFLTEPPAPPSEWSARAQKLFPSPAQDNVKKVMTAYALLLQKDFQAAAPILSDLYQHTPPEPRETLPVLLAWAQVETGRFDDAAHLVQRNHVPSTALELFGSLTFPRLLFLRAAALEKQGRREEAAHNYQLFLTLSGPDPQAFGEEARARRAIGK